MTRRLDLALFVATMAFILALYAVMFGAPATEAEVARPTSRASVDTNYLRPATVMETWEAREMLLTFYSCEELNPPCLARWTGQAPRIGTLSSNTLPAGTEVRMGNPWGVDVFVVEDTGSGIGPHQIDVFAGTRKEANRQGVKEDVVYVKEANR